jgi:hypothetical protein
MHINYAYPICMYVGRADFIQGFQMIFTRCFIFVCSIIEEGGVYVTSQEIRVTLKPVPKNLEECIDTLPLLPTRREDSLTPP